MTITPVQLSLLHKIASPNSDQNPPFPTLILLHGRGTNEDDLLGLVSYLDPRFMVISARAPFRFSYGGYTWYDVLEVGSPEPQQFAESYERLIQFLADVQQHYPVDANQVFLLGFSMGTMMSYALALTKPKEIAGVVAHSGYIPEHPLLLFKWDELDQTGFFVAHGVHDPVIPIHFGRRAKELLSKTNADLTYREYPIAHQISEESLRDLSAWLQKRLNVSVEKK